MKKLLIVFFILIIAFSALAEVSECENQYISAAKKKNERIVDKFMGPITIAPTIILGILNPIAGASYLVLSNLAAYKITQNNSEIAIEDLLHSLESGRFRRLHTKARRIDPTITQEEISEIIVEGFESGAFCSGKKLFTPRQINNYVLDQI